FNTCWRYFYYSSDEARNEGVLLRYRMMNVQCMYDNVKVYNFASTKDIAMPDETGGEAAGGSADAVENVTGGGEISTDKVTKRDGKWYIPVTVKSEYLTATQLSFALDFDKTKASFCALEGLDEGTYGVTETDGGIVIDFKDLTRVKGLKAGDKFFDIVLTANDPDAAKDDLKLRLSDKYTYSVATGDNMITVIVGIASAVTGIVFIAKRRKEAASC
ncbi:MAG: hypothetical protein PUC29_08255, partial [Clostridia bacterium]|nr:hypothetical protein [Clostridia bacterium]